MISDMIAYLCDGVVPECSGKPWCYKCALPMPDSHIICKHTTNSSHAINGPCENPEAEVPQRFKRFVVGEYEIRYFEEPEEDS